MERVIQIKFQVTTIHISTGLYFRSVNLIVKYLANRIKFSICILAVRSYEKSVIYWK